MPERRSAVLVAAALFAAAFALYATLACRDVAFGDGTELVASAIANGIAHAPGYPLWIVLGHLATLVPVGPLAYRVNLTAALYHALTVALVYLAGYAITRRHGAAIFAAALLAAASPLFASWALQAEVFSLNDVIAAAIVLLCLTWLHDGARWRFIVPIALLFGLGCANQQTIVLLAPLPFWVAWCRRRDFPDVRALAVTLAIAAALFFAGFALPYAHTLAASQRVTRWQLGEARSPEDLPPLILRRDFGTLTLVPVSAERGGSPLARIAATIAAGGWTYLAIALGILGLWLRRRFAEAAFAGIAAATTLAIFPALANIDISTEIARGVFLRFGLLPLVTLAPFAACAAYAVEAFLRDRPLRVAAWAIGAVALAGLASQTLPAVSLRAAHDPRTLARDMFAALPPHAILLAAGAPVESAAAYYQSAEGWRPDVTVVSYVCLFYEPCREELARSMRIPPILTELSAPNDLRDALVSANPDRAFYVAGDRPIHVGGPRSQPVVEGVVSRMIPIAAGIDLRAHYRREVALQSVPGYATVSDSFWASNGYSDEVRSFYAAGFYFAGLDAKTLRFPAAALYWFERARLFAGDPLIEAELTR